MKKIFITILLWIVFFIVGCDPNEEESVSGTYKATSMVIHPGGDCSASDGMTEICTTDPTVTSEADCPVGMCSDLSDADESSCPEDMWFTGMCEDGESLNQTSCEGAGSDWTSIGWQNSLDALDEDMTVSFADDGTFTDFEGESGTWTLDGPTLTMTDSDGEIHTAVVSGNTITIEMVNEAGCVDNADNDIVAADNTACTDAGGEWTDATTCSEMVFTRNTGESVSGTYNATSMVIHPGGDCSADDGYSGYCYTANVTTEADCPVGGYCNCSLNLSEISTEEECDSVEGVLVVLDVATEEDCVGDNGEWRVGYCFEIGTENIIMEYVIKDDCLANEGGWWAYGWNFIVDTFASGMSITLSDDGTVTFTNLSSGGPEDASGTWTLDGSILTMADSDDFPVSTGVASGNTISVEAIYNNECIEVVYTSSGS